MQELALIRMAMKHLHDVISENATFAHIASRGVSLRPSLLQRCYRDVHSGTQHILLADEIVQECGRVHDGRDQQGRAVDDVRREGIARYVARHAERATSAYCFVRGQARSARRKSQTTTSFR